MAFISNLLSRRVGVSNYWQNIWSSFTWINYSLLTSNDRIILLYIKWFIKLIQWKESKKYNKFLNNIYNQYDFTLNNKIFWLWPSWKILRCSNNIFLICNFYLQYKKYNYNEKINLSKNYKNIKLKEIKKLFLLYKNFFNNCWVLRNSIYYIFRLKYFKIIKYFYLYCYWYFNLKINLKISIFKYIMFYKTLYYINLWLISFNIQIKYFLKKVIYSSFDIYFYITPFEIVNSNWLLSFIKLKLLQNFAVKSIIMNLLTQLEFLSQDVNLYKGLKICVAGRFTRKERKLFRWHSQDFLGNTKINGWLEYAGKTVILPNSICGLKIWLRKNPYIPKIKTTFFYQKNLYKNAVYFKSKKIYKIL